MSELTGLLTLVDIVLGVLCLEMFVMWRLCLRDRRSLCAVLANLAAGAALVLAMRAAIAGMAMHWVAACLLASLAAHLVDLRSRWPRGMPRVPSP